MQHLSVSDQALLTLVEALKGQTQAIQALADSNMALVAAMAESEEMPDTPEEPAMYLDGRPRG